jgi:hypothetical protein
MFADTVARIPRHIQSPGCVTTVAQSHTASESLERLSPTSASVAPRDCHRAVTQPRESRRRRYRTAGGDGQLKGLVPPLATRAQHADVDGGVREMTWRPGRGDERELVSR